jgi:hypothetical protein
MRFADGLDRWLLGGSFAEHTSQSHWHDYTCAAGHAVAALSAAVPQPEGFAFLAQEMFADPGNHIVTVTDGSDWARHEVTARVPGDCTTAMFGVFLAGPGRVELRNAELARAS